MQAEPDNPNARPAPKVETSGSERFRNIALGVAGVLSSVLIPLLGLYYTSRDKDYLRPFLVRQ